MGGSKGGRMMTENKQEIPKEDVKKQKKAEEPLPFCTTAPSAEHARAADEDETCDDSRGSQ